MMPTGEHFVFILFYSSPIPLCGDTKAEAHPRRLSHPDASSSEGP